MWFLDYLISIADRIGEWFGNLWSHGVALARDYFWQLWDYAAFKAVKAGTLFDSWFDKIKQYVDDWRAHLDILANYWYWRIIDLADTYYFAVREYLGDRKAALVYLVTTTIAKAQDFYDVWSARARTLAVDVGDRMLDIGQNLYAQLRDLAMTSIERVRDLRDNLYARLKELAVDWGERLIHYAQTAFDRLETLRTTLFDALWDFGVNLYQRAVHFLRTVADRLDLLTGGLFGKLTQFGDYFARWWDIVVSLYDKIVWLLNVNNWLRLFNLLQSPDKTIWAWLWESLEKYICQWLAERW